VAAIGVGEAQEKAWHSIEIPVALQALGTSPDGLTNAQVEERRAMFGANVLPRPKRKSVVLVYLHQFQSPLIYLLLAAAAVSVVIGEITDAAFIFGVLQINALVGTIQEWRAETSAEALRNTVRSLARVVREGKPQQVDAEDLVPGDHVLVESGLVVPADIRLTATNELAVDESLLTGESVPVEKHAEVLFPPHEVVAGRANMLHTGTTIVRGRGAGAVVRTGLATEIGRIARALLSADTHVPPLIRRLERFSRNLGMATVGAILCIGVAQLARGMAPAEVFFVAVALAVSAIPEGLPVAITVVLSIATSRMARRNVIVRSLPAVEGLGACTLIASDKTGTLTCNELTVRRVVVAGYGTFGVTGEGYAARGEIGRHGDGPDPTTAQEALTALGAAAALTCEATFRETERGAVHIGDTVDVALLAFAAKLGIRQADLERQYPTVTLVPFESHRRFAASINRDGDRYRLSIKGAAESVLPMCRAVDSATWHGEVEYLADNGFRVIAVADRQMVSERMPTAADLVEMRFLGLVALIDPLRPEAREAVAMSRRAGIEVRMVTGDHGLTALSIARELGIAREPSQVVSGAALVDLEDDPERFSALVRDARVFARVEPLQKLAIVRALMADGHVVAVTGDGVNDAPALRAADIGVAMGRKGTDVARGAAHLVLTDDNFASIVNGIEEGRVAYDNVRRLIYLLVSTGFAEVILFVLALAASLPLPLLAVQLLWLNLVTNGIQDVALAFERGADDVLARPPRPPGQPILDRRMIEQTLISGSFMGVAAFTFFSWAISAGWSETAARNGVLLLMVLFENVHIFNCRSESRSAFRIPIAANPYVVAAAVGALALHVLAMHLPGLGEVLRIGPVQGATWATLVPIALALVVVMEIYKLVRANPGTKSYHSARGSGPRIRE
jgi:magnesium-transporting ATPase (P-type)